MSEVDRIMLRIMGGLVIGNLMMLSALIGKLLVVLK